MIHLLRKVKHHLSGVPSLPFRGGVRAGARVTRTYTRDDTWQFVTPPLDAEWAGEQLRQGKSLHTEGDKWVAR